MHPQRFLEDIPELLRRATSPCLHVLCFVPVCSMNLHVKDLGVSSLGL